MTFIFTSDHAGIALIRALMKRIDEVVVLDDPVTSCVMHNFGPISTDSVDYPDYAHLACRYLADKPDHIGVFICGTGIGMSMVANRYHHIRCAVAVTPEMAEWTRKHNDANVLALGTKLVDEDMAVAILKAFVQTPYEGSERHVRRIAKINPENP